MAFPSEIEDRGHICSSAFGPAMNSFVTNVPDQEKPRVPVFFA